TSPLDLLPGAAPAGVVASDVLVLVHRLLLNGYRARGNRSLLERRRRPARGGDGVRADGGLVRVLQIAVVGLHRLEVGLLDLDGNVEEGEDHLFASRLAELLEQHVPLTAVLDERILLGK